MDFADIASQAAIVQAIEEFDQLGRPAFLANYHFSEARRYFLVRNGQLYDSKAIVGVAHANIQEHHRKPLLALAPAGTGATTLLTVFEQHT